MSNVLFINLKRNGDIFNTAALAFSYLKEHPHATPYILTYNEFKKATKPLSIFKSVFTLDRKKLTAFHSHNLYSNGFALDELLDELKPLESINWSEIINYSSDKASTFLTNYLACSSKATIKGVHFGDSNNLNYKSDWNIIFNEVMTSSALSPVHFSTAYHGMVNVPSHSGPIELKTISKHNETVKNNFSSLRKQKSPKGGTCSLIGIQVASSQSNKDWSKGKLAEVIELILDDPTLYPIVLIAPNDEERRLSKEINAQFDSKLIIVESDFIALSSVLRGIDLLVTPDTSVKHLADLSDCKVIECSNNFKTSLKQGTIRSGNIILNGVKDSKVVHNSIKFLLHPTIPALESLLDPSVYITYFDSLGWNLRPLAGHFTRDMFLRQVKRVYIARWTGVAHRWDIKDYFSDYTYSEVQNIIDEEKESVSSAGRDLLGTLRSLIKASDSKSEVNGFIASLDKLLTHTGSDNVVSIAVTEFKARIENLKVSNKDEQLRAVEELLYKLKKKIQIVLECLNDVEKDARSMPVANRNKSELQSSEVNA